MELKLFLNQQASLYLVKLYSTKVNVVDINMSNIKAQSIAVLNILMAGGRICRNSYYDVLI